MGQTQQQQIQQQEIDSLMTKFNNSLAIQPQNTYGGPQTQAKSRNMNPTTSGNQFKTTSSIGSTKAVNNQGNNTNNGFMGLGMSKTLIGSQLGLATNNSIAVPSDAKSRLSTHNKNNFMGSSSKNQMQQQQQILVQDVDTSSGVPMIVTADPLAYKINEKCCLYYNSLQNSLHGKKTSHNTNGAGKFNQTVANSSINNNTNLYSMIQTFYKLIIILLFFIYQNRQKNLVSSYLNGVNTTTNPSQSSTKQLRGSSNQPKITGSSGSSRNKNNLMAPMATKNTQMITNKTRNGGVIGLIGSTLDVHSSQSNNMGLSMGNGLISDNNINKSLASRYSKQY